MHFYLHVEDASGKAMLSALMPKILELAESSGPDTFEIKNYQGIGHIPKKMKDPASAKKAMLLQNLPPLLRAYGKTFQGHKKSGYASCVVIVCDLDDRCLREFKSELLAILSQCNPRPEACFCFAVEEGEAWLLGDLDAVKRAFPNAKPDALASYVNDSICGTWELLARALGNKSKVQWAEKIAPLMDASKNKSPSFRYFRDKIVALAKQRRKP